MLADWEALDMEVVATASNGIQALELIQFHDPHILITDIRMPGMDGLELIKKAKVIAPELEIAVISGYAQFEYAQPAIKHGVVDYLLKPIKQEELMGTLKKLSKCCLERIESDNVVQKLIKSTAENTDRLREKLIFDLFYKNIDTTNSNLEQDYKFNYKEDDCLQVFVTKIDYNLQTCSDLTISALQKNSESVFKTVLGRYVRDLIYTSINSYSFGIITFKKENTPQIRKAFKESFALLNAKQSLYGKTSLSLALGESTHTSNAIAEAFGTALITISQRLINEHEKFIEWSPTPPVQTNINMLEKYSKALEKVIESHNFDNLSFIVEILKNSIDDTPNVNGIFLCETILKAANLFILRIGVENSERVVRLFEAGSDLCGTKKQLFDYLIDFQHEQLHVILTKTQNDSIRPIRLAKQYIQTHYNEQISLEEVSDQVGLSLNYFSALFKKKTGEGFAKYVIRIRIEKAKGLLQETNLSISEICFKVGYTDLTHFTQNFKKVTGLNPSQYRKLYG